MTLTDMASYICSKVNQTEDDDVAACKTFIRRRYESVWADQLWKDSLAMVGITLDPDNSDNAAGVVVLPELIDRPVAVRGADRAVLVNPLERYFRIDLDMFARTGQQFEFSPISPAWLTVRPDATLWDDITSTLDNTGHSTHYDATCSIGDMFRFFNGTQQQMNVQSPDLSLSLTVLAGETVYFTATQTTVRFIFSTTPLTLMDSVVSKLNVTALPDDTSSGAGATITIASSTPGDSSNLKVIYRDLAGKRYEITSALPSITLTPDDDAGQFEIEVIFKSTTTGTVTVTLNDASGLTSILGTLLPTATRTPSYQRIRVFDIPAASAVLQVAGKIKCDALDFDNQEPVLRGCENILITLGQADMLERERRYGQAQALLSEAALLLEQLKKVESVQQAHNVRIIPEEGYGCPWEFNAPQTLLTF